MDSVRPIDLLDRLTPPRRRRVARRTLLRAVVGAAPAVLVAKLQGRPITWRTFLGSAVASTAIEAPGVGVGLGGCLLGVTAFRPLPPDDLADVAAGALGAAATLAAFPRIDDTPARGVALSERQHVSPAVDGEGLTIVVNPRSGSGAGEDVADAIAAELPAAEIVPCESGADLEEALREAAGRGRTLGIIGGDGSVNSAARIALDTGVPLAVFPGGTLNHFARDLGVDSVAAAAGAVRHGHVAAIDVGTIADRLFLNNASIGSYAALVDERERLENRLGKWPAMVVALVRVLRRGARFDIVLDGDARKVWMVFFGNCRFEPAGFAPADRPDLVDGLLDVRLVDASSPWSRVRVVSAVLLGALGRSRVYERHVVPRISVVCEGDGPVRLAADGETFDGPPAFEVAKRPAALLVHAPDPDGP